MRITRNSHEHVVLEIRRSHVIRLWSKKKEQFEYYVINLKTHNIDIVINKYCISGSREIRTQRLYQHRVVQMGQIAPQAGRNLCKCSTILHRTYANMLRIRAAKEFYFILERLD